ncbi:MAG: lytic transglycosylase domain-containing protein [Clostridia bacterium]|nr:lytic transglycosylase domain-containing protein [Clostridia bacterium]
MKKRKWLIVEAAVAVALIALTVFGLSRLFARKPAERLPSALPTEPPYPLLYTESIDRWADEYQLEKARVAAVIYCESSFRPNETSRTGAVGLMQIMPNTGSWIAEKLGDDSYTESSLLDPDTNIRYGCWYLNYLEKRFGSDLATVTAAYHAGEGNVSKWLQDKAFSADGKKLTAIPESNPETQKYVSRIALALVAYRKLYS